MLGAQTVQEMRELVDLAARGVVRSHVSRVGSLDEAADVFDEIEAGAYLGRGVIRLCVRGSVGLNP